MHRKGFTLIEMLLVLSGFVILVGIIWGIYQGLFRMRADVSARQLVIEQTYYTLERIHTMLEDFTIDYEEYRNRRMVGCSGFGPVWNIGELGHCTNFTYHGNHNPETVQHSIYYCSSIAVDDGVLLRMPGDDDYDSCAQFGPQSFGQYAELFWDRGTDVSGDGRVFGDADDRDMGVGPAAILDPDNVPELYLISPDNTRRLFIRRALVQTSDDNHKRYTLQILRLQGLDAGSNHDFAIGDPTVYDGQIDTRACDAAQGFFCSGPAVGGVYTGYNLASHIDDGRVDLLDERLTVVDRRLEIYPTKNPDYAWNDLSVQIQPYIRVFLETALYTPAWSSLISEEAVSFSFPIQTTFNTKTWYTR